MHDNKDHVIDAAFLLSIVVCLAVFALLATYGACHGVAL